jgi:hypothetical protein
MPAARSAAKTQSPGAGLCLRHLSRKIVAQLEFIFACPSATPFLIRPWIETQIREMI